MSAAAIACSRGAAALGFRCRSLMRLPAAQVGCPRSNLSLLQRFSSDESNGSRACLIDTLALVKRLEKEGVPSKQAEAITEVLNESLESVAQSFVSKPEMQRSEMIQDSNLWKFKLEMKGSQDHHYALLQRETEKLRVDIEKMRSELRYEIDKVTAGQRLDLNLERGRIRDGLRDELAKQSAETTELITKLDRKILTLRAQLDAAKHDAIKFCIGTLVSISTVACQIAALSVRVLASRSDRGDHIHRLLR
ncbi:hypothetical protein C4D60_Mb04t27060 [Musa balbisiana]|uniref:DUF1640 domain-containing protein n=1 Tax=Musa balbisiana TaxID=52838 RepID=A0A4S8KFI6_MUSBA|nr:hypothetical protein C4D60_Mb04t27060 [Musa balbisiana]